jgi:isopentenyl-diphosphate delta-isomerase
MNPVATKKDLHIEACINGSVKGSISNGFEKFRFMHNALPGIDLGEVDTSVEFMGKRLSAPILIAPMTGGCERGMKINRTLAEAAQSLGLAMAVGSQRAAIEDAELTSTFEVRDVAPDILLFANFGAVQLNRGFAAAECGRAVEMISADGLMLHLNPLQEALQENGDTCYAGLLSKIKEIAEKIDVPLVIREVSFGISKSTAAEIVRTGVAGIDVGGAGGTSWALVEGYLNGDHQIKQIAESFSSWGVSTSESIQNVRDVDPDMPVIATGGIRSGLDIAKAIALGADMAGIARPLLQHAEESVEKVKKYLEGIIHGLRISMFCLGCRDIASLKREPLKKI